MKEKKKYTIFAFDEVREHGKAKAEVAPHTDTVVPPSGQNQITQPGRKCEHGGYIPVTSASPDHAPFCTLCRPYLLEKI